MIVRASVIVCEHLACVVHLSDFCVRSPTITCQPGFIDNKDFLSPGWGQDNGGSASTYLKQSKVPVYTHQECRQKHWVSEKDNICLGGRGSSACFGDSGGPLVCEESGRWVLRGASSYVTGKNCPVDKYSVYARVSSYINWINGYIGGGGGGGAGGGGT